MCEFTQYSPNIIKCNKMGGGGGAEKYPLTYFKCIVCSNETDFED